MTARLAALNRLLAASLAALLLPVLTFPSPAATTATIDGVLHVRNAAEPASGTRRVGLVERWSAGGDEGETFFGVIDDAVADAAGNVYLLDRQLCQIFVYSPQGELLRALGREGEGPGEFRSPTDLCWISSTTLAVIHRAPGLVTLIDSDGNPQGSIRLFLADGRASSASLRGIAFHGGLLAAAGMEHVIVGDNFEQRRFLALYDRDGAEKVRLFEGGSGFDYGARTFVERDDYFVEPARWTLGADGSIFAAPDRDRYRIQVHRSDGSLARVIERDYEPRRRTAQEKASAGNVSMWVHGEPVAVQATVEDTEACIERLVCLPAGNLWVLHGAGLHDMPEGVFHRYDVFASSGEYLECVEIACPGDPQRDRLIALDERRFVLVRNFTDAVDAMYGGADPAADAAPLAVAFLEAQP